MAWCSSISFGNPYFKSFRSQGLVGEIMTSFDNTLDGQVISFTDCGM